MSLDKSISKGTEHRKQYRGGKAIDRMCRNHGGCEVCLRNRTHKYIKKIQALNQKLEEFKKVS